jgi:hypothetical protein
MTTKVKASVLADTAVSTGTYGGTTQHAVVTVDQQGRITYAANATPSIANTQITGLITNAQIASMDAAKITALITSSQITSIANTQITGLITAAQIAGIASNQITGSITSGQITSLASTQITGTISAAQLANTQTYGINVNGTSITGTTVSDSKGGVRALPINTQSGAYTLVAGDMGKVISTTAGIVVPASTFVAGDNITIFNNSSSSITITCSAITAYRSGVTTASTSLTLTGRGVCTFLFYASDAAVVTGTI